MAVTSYCTSDDLIAVGINERYLEQIDTARLTTAIDGISRKIDSYLTDRYKLPLQAIGSDIKRCCAILVAYDVASGQGYNPGDPGDDNLRLRAKDELQWLRDVASGQSTPFGIVDSSDSGASGLPSLKAKIVSNTQIGYFKSDGRGGPFSGGR